ncbi:MAG: ATP-binding protein [Clostridiales Family XIII bacterium]|jgi:predicted AAA+ superfamily ATPase|nr:ATP-binding protein [Clostridiales Family XIII bacterium]
MVTRDMYIDRIRTFFNQPEIIKILVGIRRCGKSVMLELIQEELVRQGAKRENFISLNFEKMSLSELRNPVKLDSYIKPLIENMDGQAYVFLDEIQEVDGWERWINSLRVETDADIYITGSNAKLLEGEYVTLIGGRYISLRMLPFTFKEYLPCIKESEADISDRDAFRKYIIVGGMPFVAALNLSENDAVAYLQDIFSSVVVKDVVKRNGIRDIDLLERVLSYVFANIGQPFSANSISNFFLSEKRKVAPDTILNYLKACQEAYLIYKLERLDVPSKRQLKVDEKYFIADHGLREAVYGGNARDIERVLENIVCVELLSRRYEVRIGRVENAEIDFVCDRGAERIYVQVSYLLASDETIEREFGVYRNITDNYPKYVISTDEFDMSRDGIIHRNIVDFLLSSDI